MKYILVVYLISLLGTGNGVYEKEQRSNFDTFPQCEAALKHIVVKDFGKDFSGRFVAYCAPSNMTEKNVQP